MYSFKVWDQSNDGQTMAIRAVDVDALAELSTGCSQPDMAENWDSLQHYLDNAATASVAPIPYVRPVDVLWERAGVGVPQWSLCQDRRLRVTYSGNVRASGGFASQAYVVLDPAWNLALRPFDKEPLQVRYFAGPRRDLLVVLA